MPVIATRREAFTTGHRLYIPTFSADRPREVFGRCSKPSGHGHNCGPKVSATGPIDPRTGYVCRLRVLSELIRKVIIDEVDHRNLNKGVEWLGGLNSTTCSLPPSGSG